MALTRAQRVQIQRDLIALGYDPNGADGLLGAGTREAIRAWQRNTGQPATGYVTVVQINSLRADAEALGSDATGNRARSGGPKPAGPDPGRAGEPPATAHQPRLLDGSS